MKFIDTLRDGDRISDIYLCKNKVSAVTKNGKEYLSVLLQDKTGTIDAKIWEPNSMGIGDFDILDYIEVVADVTSFNSLLQLSVKRVRKVYEGEYNPADYLPTSEKNVDDMYTEIVKYINSIENEYLNVMLTKIYIEDIELADRFKSHSAAKSVHHGFIGGLLQHTLAVTMMCNFYCTQYPIINRDLLLSAALVHDIGKMWEISAFPMNDYTDDGQLVGHIIIGIEKVGAVINDIPDFPHKLATELKHCILAHHGELEYGSPKKPALIEAMALHFADNTDAKLQTITELLSSKSVNGDGWIGYQRMLETNIRKTSL